MRTGFGRRAALPGAIAFAIVLAGCGGTRVTDEAIEQAAGVGPAQQVVAGAGSAPAAGSGTSTAPGAPVDDVGAAGPNPAADAGGADAGPRAQAPGGGQPGAGSGSGSPGAQGPSGTRPGGDGGADPAAQRPAGGGDRPAASGERSAGPATKSVIRLGVVGTFSGPVGALVKDTATGARVWGQYINDNGGVNGHPVDILVGDDGGDPARFNSIAQQFVEEEGVIAFLYNTLGFSPNGANKYLDSKKIFTFGTEGGLETAYTNPYVLTATPTGLSNADSIAFALAKAVIPQGKSKLAVFACSDFGLCDNFDNRFSDPGIQKRTGFELLVRGRPSLTQPDYTSQCLSAKQAGAEVVMLVLDTASLRRFAGDCARQDYRPIFGTADLLALPSLPADPNADGVVVATKMAPWVDTSVPGIAELHKAFATYVPGVEVSGGNSNGWILGEFFAAAGANLPDNPTPADVEKGLYSIKKNNLNGMTYPITMTKGQPVARQLCYGVVVVKDKKYTKLPGPSLYCEKDARLSSSVSGSVAESAAGSAGPAAAFSASPTGRYSAATQGAPTRAALLARPSAAADCPPARAAGFSYLLDAFQTGSSAGPGVAYGIALAALGTPLPDPLGAAQGQFLAQSGSAVEQFSDDAPAAIAESRSQFEPFAVYNDFGNAFIDAGATTLDAIADNAGPFIQPGDRSLREVAAAMRDARATNVPCDVVVGSASAPSIKALATAFATGEGQKAAALIRDQNLAGDSAALGEAVFLGGIASTEANTFDAFRMGVARGFVDGGVDPATAGQAFAAAASKAAAEGVTFEQGAVGFRTIVETYQAYLVGGAG